MREERLISDISTMKVVLADEKLSSWSLDAKDMEREREREREIRICYKFICWVGRSNTLKNWRNSPKPTSCRISSQFSKGLSPIRTQINTWPNPKSTRPKPLHLNTHQPTYIFEAPSQCSCGHKGKYTLAEWANHLHAWIYVPNYEFRV